ncbi:hypothetical protein QQS45_10120 [Alteriqipengyuania flavescens]|uniref:hypothetical protein n=1 Tax=Alteriqipengyuania flavescens TaxID=3053610 RepID=UPI0025B5BE65|nr:hypothetical protein [Alteriqipengyuania flavescens]WJY17979.1 hypothetical protein QQW98_10115 [Alteriqipengyuania flavescens]WJY23920.1 hypothetical protein QQS45_10120 [Alteriqipengyuania flavescens]
MPTEVPACAGTRAGIRAGTHTDRSRHTVFTPRAKGEFLQSLQLFGNVRVACRVARISAQTAYRARRASPVLARLWDAALLAARAHAEATLADRAINGVEEAVFYHGEEVARRRRFDSRLLLAHLARLDRLEERPEVAGALDLLDDAIAALARGGEAEDALPPARVAQLLRPGSPQKGVPPVPSERVGAGAAPTPVQQVTADDVAPPCTCPAARAGVDNGRPHYRMTGAGPTPVTNMGDGHSPCCERPDFPECRDCPHFSALSRLYGEMDEARPEGAPTMEELAELAGEGGYAEVEACQLQAYEDGFTDWWRVGADFALYTREEDGTLVEVEETPPSETLVEDLEADGAGA